VRFGGEEDGGDIKAYSDENEHVGNWDSVQFWPLNPARRVESVVVADVSVMLVNEIEVYQSEYSRCGDLAKAEEEDHRLNDSVSILVDILARVLADFCNRIAASFERLQRISSNGGTGLLHDDCQCRYAVHFKSTMFCVWRLTVKTKRGE